MKEKNRKCRKIGNSKGFITPSKELEIGKYYDLTITEPGGEPTTEPPKVEQ